MKLGQKIAINYIRAKLNFLAVFSTKKAAEKAFDLFCTPLRKKRKDPSSIFLQAEQLKLQVNGNAICGYRWNKGGSKKVLLLHGFESAVKNFEAYVQPLIHKNYEVLAFDAPGHGISDGKKITLPLYIEAIRTIYFEIGTIQSFMAHSFGGLAAMHFIEKIPHDVNTRLAVIAPATETKTAVDSFFTFLQLSNTVKKEFEKIIIKKSGHPSTHFSIPRSIANVNASILWVHDKQDDITPLADVLPIMETKYAHVQFFITDGLGHKKIYRDSKVKQAVIDFL